MATKSEHARITARAISRALNEHSPSDLTTTIADAAVAHAEDIARSMGVEWDTDHDDSDAVYAAVFERDLGVAC